MQSRSLPKAALPMFPLPVCWGRVTRPVWERDWALCTSVQKSQISFTPVSDAILKNILVQKFDAFYLSNTAGIHNVEFFFSAIASQEKKKGSINENTDEESSSEDEIPSSFSQQWLEGNLTNVNKSLCPAIAYWVALTTVKGAPVSPISVHKALLNSG